MVEIIDIAPKALGLKIDGKITEDDMRSIIKICEHKLEAQERIAILVEVIHMGGISLNALVEDIKFAIPNLKKFSKKAVISDSKWHEPMIKIGDKLFPSIEVKHFKPEQREVALEWVKE